MKEANREIVRWFYLWAVAIASHIRPTWVRPMMRHLPPSLY